MPLHRRVFFIAGFDPKSPRYYHHLYRSLALHRPAGAEGAGGPPVEVGPRKRLNDWADEWDVRWPTAAHGGQTLDTRFTLLRWDDIVRAHWGRSARTVWRDHWNFYVDGTRQGFFGRVWRASRLHAMFVTFPLAMLLAWCVLWAALAGGLIGVMAPAWPLWALLAVAALSTVVAIQGWQRMSHRLGTDWLMRLYGFSHAQAAGRIEGLDARIDAMGALIAGATEEAPVPREILVVGHSTGTILAASAVARAIAGRAHRPGNGPQLALLTLGHCTPLVAYFQTAQSFRAELDAMTAHEELTWVDYSAPADWAACALMAPWGRPGKALLHRLSPRFPKILDPARYRALRRNRMALHMQYLRPADRAGHYDLLALTAGPATLRERHPPAGATVP
jgi:hypothetical protein